MSYQNGSKIQVGDKVSYTEYNEQDARYGMGMSNYTSKVKNIRVYNVYEIVLENGAVKDPRSLTKLASGGKRRKTRKISYKE